MCHVLCCVAFSSSVECPCRRALHTPTFIYQRGLDYRADTAEEALNLLFLGDTNRMIAETPMNMASSRSHCVFTMHLEARRPGESVVRRSKLHLVDLAGSERVGRTGIDGTVLTEAKYINASLHFLEQVIIALQVCTSTTGMHQNYRYAPAPQVLRERKILENLESRNLLHTATCPTDA